MQRKLLYLLILLTVILLSNQTILAGDLNIAGELKQVLNYDLENDEMIQTDSEYKIEFSKGLGYDGDLYLSLAGSYDALEEKGEIDLDEAYTAIYFPIIDLLVGKQVINWGTADGINPTNNINPIDISSFTEGELTGEPVLSAQATYYGDNMDVTGVLIFDFLPQDLKAMSDYLGEEGALLAEVDVKSPENKVKNMEYALKIDKRIAGYDLKFSYFHGWEDLPGKIDANLNSNYQPDLTTLKGAYRQVDKFGIATAGAIKTLGIWGELAYVIPDNKRVSSNDPGEVTILTAMKKPYLQAVLGTDYTFANGVYVEGQYMYYENGSIFSPYHQGDINDNDVKAGQYIMGRASYTFNKNQIELTSLLNISDNSALVMPIYRRALTPVTDLKVSPIIPLGEDDGELKMLNRQFKVSIETSF